MDKTIILDQESSILFSRGLIANSLLKTGLSFLEAHKIADEIRRDLLKMKIQEISRQEALLMFEAEKVADIGYHNMKFMLDATQEVRNSMMQHISQLKIEQKNIAPQT